MEGNCRLDQGNFCLQFKLLFKENFSEMQSKLRLRFQYDTDRNDTSGDKRVILKMCYKTWDSYLRFFEPAEFGVCPGCEKDLTLFDEDGDF